MDLSKPSLKRQLTENKWEYAEEVLKDTTIINKGIKELIVERGHNYIFILRKENDEYSRKYFKISE